MFGRKGPKKILVIKLGGLAEFVNAEPALSALRAAHKDDEITCLTTPTLAKLIKAAPFFDVVWSDGAPADKQSSKLLMARLKREKFARIYDFDNSPETARMFKGFGAFKPKWSGAARGAAFRFAPKDAPHQIDRYLGQLAAADVPATQRKPDLGWTFAARKDAANMKPSWFGIGGAYVLLCPTLDGPAHWPNAQYASFANAVAERGMTPVLVGGRELRDMGDLLSRHAPSIINLAGKTDLLQLAALAREAAFFVGDDCDTAIYVAAANTPGVSLLQKAVSENPAAPRDRAVISILADNLIDLPVDDVLRTAGNAGLLPPPAPRLKAASS